MYDCFLKAILRCVCSGLCLRTVYRFRSKSQLCNVRVNQKFVSVSVLSGDVQITPVLANTSSLVSDWNAENVRVKCRKTADRLWLVKPALVSG